MKRLFALSCLLLTLLLLVLGLNQTQFVTAQARGSTPEDGSTSIAAVPEVSHSNTVMPIEDVGQFDENTPLGNGTTRRVSVASDGTQGNWNSYEPSISADGRVIAFTSGASNLVSDDTTGGVFVHDQVTGQTTRVSVASDGTPANNAQGGSSYRPTISANGRYVTFISYADNLVNDDTNQKIDMFIHDRQTGQTSRISVASDGSQANNNSTEAASISSDGRIVAFSSYASNLVSDDTNNQADIFVHDRQTGQTTRVSHSSDGSQANKQSEAPAISADGRYVAFSSYASNLVESDTNGTWDVFVHDRQTGQTTRVSVASDGSQANGVSGSFYCVSISADGRYVAFYSSASNLVEGDTNNARDAFVHDRDTGQTTRVSLVSDGTQSQSSDVSSIVISGDGRYVTFASNFPFVADDTNNYKDLFVHDRQTGETTRVSVASDGSQGNNHLDYWNYYLPAISADGRYVAFHSWASNLVSGDTNGQQDVFVRDRMPTYSISGRVADDSGTGIAGVTVSASGGHSATTDSNGNYTIAGLAPGNYTLTPSKEGYTFEPASRSVSIQSADVTGVDFVGTGTVIPTPTPTATPGPSIYSISGRVTDGSGTGIEGVTVSASGGRSATTDSNGDYTIADLVPGNYTLTPSKDKIHFLPSNRSVEVPPNQTNIDFVIDTDGDAIPDGWEVFGYDVDGDGTPEVDLPAMGADPLHKDIFVEVDYFVKYDEIIGFVYTSHTHRPKDKAIAIVVKAFDEAPVDNPDKTPGIHLHVDYGSDAPLTWGAAETWGELSQTTVMTDRNYLQELDEEWDWSGFDQVKDFNAYRAPIFHYALFVSDLGGNKDIGTSGTSRNNYFVFRKGGSDFVVSLGRYPSRSNREIGDGVGNVKNQAGTFMHELGHNLGLSHGGLFDGDNADHMKRKPNYLSVMNYLFQHDGLIKNEEDGHFDYSRFSDIPSLNESSLDETVGLDTTSIETYGTRYYCWTTDNKSERKKQNMRVTKANDPINWDCTGVADGTNVKADINGDKITTTLDMSVDDWSHLVYDGGSIGGGSNMEALENPTRTQLGDPIDEEMTYEMYQRLYRPYDIALSADTDMVVSPGATSVISVTLTNLGALTATVSLDTELDNGWFDFSALPTAITVNPSTTLSFPVILTVPSEATEGEVQATITAEVQESTRIFDSTTFKVHVGPLAWFTTESTNEPYTLVFTDISIGNVTSWSWDFGDSTTSTSQNPIHTYAAQGNYRVSLTVSGPDGSDTLTRTYFVETIETEQSELYLPLITR